MRIIKIVGLVERRYVFRLLITKPFKLITVCVCVAAKSAVLTTPATECVLRLVQADEQRQKIFFLLVT